MKILADTVQVLGSDLDLQSNKIVGLADGTDPQDGATKNQVDTAGPPTGFTEIVTYLENKMDQIQFTDSPADAISITAGNPVDIKIGITDADGDVVPWPLDFATEVTLVVVGNTTGDTPSADGDPIGAGKVLDLSAANEITTQITMSGVGVGTLTLGLVDSGASGLDVTDEFVITFT